MQLFLEYSDKLSETKSEIVYRYIHPTFGEMFVRCSGIRDRSVVDGISIMGIHQDISETVRLEKEKEAERRLAELNDTLRKEKITGRLLQRTAGNAKLWCPCIYNSRA